MGFPRCFLSAFIILGIGSAFFAADERAEDPSVRVLFWNLENYLFSTSEEGEAPELRKSASSVEAIVKAISEASPDVLSVCEIGGLEAVTDLQTRLNAEGLELRHVEWVDAADPERHLALLSRFPIVARDSRTDLVYQMDRLEFPIQRGILDATLQISPDFALRCVGVHFKSKREIPEGDQALMRRNEAHLLRQHLDEIPASTNLLVFGDFNATRNEVEMRAVRGPTESEGALTLLDAEDEDGHRWTHYWSSADIYSRIDYLLANRELLNKVVADSPQILRVPGGDAVSDHRPLVVDLQK